MPESLRPLIKASLWAAVLDTWERSVIVVESVNLEREFRIAEKAYGTDHLDAVLINGYVRKLLSNARVVRYLAQHHGEILAEFQKLSESETAAA